MVTERFDRLDERISRLLDACEALKAENRALKEALSTKASELDGLHGRLKRLEAEKGEVKDRVEGLLTRLDGLIQSA